MLRKYCQLSYLQKIYLENDWLNTYNYSNNNKEQFEEFCIRYRSFEFDNLLEDKYKYKNILLKEVV